MKELWRKVWYSEPVIFVGAFVAAWLALATLDQGMDTWEIPLWVYIVMTLAVPFLTGVTRNQVTAPANLPRSGADAVPPERLQDSR